MNLDAIWTMVASDLRQRVRDRSVLVFGLIVPLALMAVFNLVFGGFDEDLELEPIAVGIANEGGGVGDTLAATLTSIPDLDISVRDIDAASAEAAVDVGELDVAVLLDPDFDAQLTSGASPQVDIVEQADGGIEADVAVAITQAWVDQVAATTRAAAAVAQHDPTAIGDVVATLSAGAPPGLQVVPGEASSEQLSLQGYLVAGQAALFVFFTVGFGVIAYVQEREFGTLPRLQSMPIQPRAIIIAKALGSFVLGVLATGVLLGAGSVLFGVDFGNPALVAVLILALVAAVTSLVLLVIRIARTAEQAQIANSIFGMVLGLLGGSFFPITGAGWLVALSDLTPPAAFIRGLGIVNGGGGLADLGPSLAILFGFLVVATLVGLVLPVRSAEAA